MNDIDILIDSWAKSLSERLVEIRYVDVDVMKAAMITHLKSAIIDCLKIQLSDTEKKLAETKRHYVNFGGGKNNHIQAEIISLKVKLKEQRELMHHFDDHIKLVELIKWMREYHEPSLLSFYEHFNEVRPIKRKINQ